MQTAATNCGFHIIPYLPLQARKFLLCCILCGPPSLYNRSIAGLKQIWSIATLFPDQQIKETNTFLCLINTLIHLKCYVRHSLQYAGQAVRLKLGSVHISGCSAAIRMQDWVSMSRQGFWMMVSTVVSPWQGTLITSRKGASTTKMSIYCY